ncbi:hypothetical protein KA005_66045, partial [bacterium]|nr:hypothetical protein [bacterium]
MPICGICEQGKTSWHGQVFHAVEECAHKRLFICGECMENVAVQRSYHEMCYECQEHLSLQEVSNISKDPQYRWMVFGDVIRDFEKSHAALFEKLPATTDRDCIHLGSLHPEELKKRREK